MNDPKEAEGAEASPADGAAGGPDQTAAPEAFAPEEIEPAAAVEAEPDPLELMRAEISDLKDKLLRAMAETENLRRRGDREKADLRKYATAEFARDMLGVADNLQRALAAVPEGARQDNPALAQLLEGVEMTEREFRGHLEKHGIREVHPLGEKLDPNLHQAMVQLDHPEAPVGTVVEVMQIGYTIHDRLLRAAMVGVSKGPPAGVETGDSPAEEPPAEDGGQAVDTKA